MSAQILYGKEVAKSIRESLMTQVEEQKRTSSTPLKLVTLRIGNFEDAKLYAQSIAKLMERFGIELQQMELGDEVGVEDVKQEIAKISARDDVTGILLLSPIPKHLNYQELVRVIPTEKDAEGTRYSAQQGANAVYPPTAMAVLEMILASGVKVEGAEAVVVGRSGIVGRPAAELLLQRHATVTICHTRTQDLAYHIGRADIVVAAAGKANLIRGEWIKPGAVVADAGENVIDGKLAGDVEFEAAKERAGFITPVPAGVGPVTSLMLVRNLLSLSRAAAIPQG